MKILGKYIEEFIRSLLAFLGRVIEKNIWLVGVLFAFVWFWDNKVDMSLLKNYLDKSNSVLQEGQVAKAEVDLRTDTIVLQEKGKAPKIVSGVKTATFTKYDDGTYKAQYNNKGFGLEPGLVITAADGLRLGLDLEWLYWRRWGIITGGTVSVLQRDIHGLRGHVGVSYDIPSPWFSNSSIWLGVDSSKNPMIGLRNRFGGGI